MTIDAPKSAVVTVVLSAFLLGAGSAWLLLPGSTAAGPTATPTATRLARLDAPERPQPARPRSNAQPTGPRVTTPRVSQPRNAPSPSDRKVRPRRGAVERRLKLIPPC